MSDVPILGVVDAEPNVRRLGDTQRKPHPWDGLEAQGDWVVCEQVMCEEQTSGGIHIPEQAQMKIWVLVSVGETCPTHWAAGQRVLFVQNTTQTVAYEGRTFALVDKKQICMKLPMPTPEQMQRIKVVPSLNGALS